MMFSVQVKDLSFAYQKEGRQILKHISLDASPGEALAIVGLSGIGKSTLCYCMSGIIPHVYNGHMTGQVYILGEDTQNLSLPQIATRLGVVFQNPDNQLFSPTVEDEIAFGPENLCLPREEIARRVDEALSVAGIEHLRFSSPHRLSGGQKQLVALASVLSLNPQILIFDEAMSQLDEQGRNSVKNLIRKLKNEGRTILMVEHDLANLAVADRVMILEDGWLSECFGPVSLKKGVPE
jgi:energy-coupling factor transport system ATP-binding protein